MANGPSELAVTEPACQADDRGLLYTSEVMGTTASGDVPDPPAVTPDLSRVCSVGLDGGAPRLVAEVEGPLDQLATSPDGRYLLYGISFGNAHLIDTASGDTRRVGTEITAPTWSADGD